MNCPYDAADWDHPCEYVEDDRDWAGIEHCSLPEIELCPYRKELNEKAREKDRF